MHLTAAIFGDPEFFRLFGKQGTENDLLIRNQSGSGSVITYVAPDSEKVQPLLQAAAMADYPVVVVNGITPEIGEVLVLLDESGFENGLVVTDFYEDKVKSMIEGMKISCFEFVKKGENLVREKISSVALKRPETPVVTPIDNYFPVKGVGTVVLGLVKSGQVKQYDKLVCYPSGKEVLVKSMQSQDRDVKETEPGQRIGLALKGIEADELKRGYVFSDKEMPCPRSLVVDAQKSRYSKFEFAVGKRLMVNVGLQVVGGEITKMEGDKLTIELDAPVAVYQQNCILASADVMPRIIGHGTCQ